MAQLDKLYRQWLDRQPLSADDEKRLKRKFMLDFNYNSNHIEGNTLTYGQTAVSYTHQRAQDPPEQLI